jgi:predicted dehydrogenase
MNAPVTRRSFVRRAALAAGAAFAAPSIMRAQRSANENLNIAVIGVGGRGAGNLDGVRGENLVALCDVDAHTLGATGQKFPGAKLYKDFRRMLDQKDIEAVVVSCPDHTHAACCVAAMKSGRHVYCEKPLARTVSEARIITDTARATKRVTQMGNQIHSTANYRRVVELVQSGVIGPVTEVHIWAAAIYGDKKRPAVSPPVPAHIDYELWLGPVEPRPYFAEYVPFHWRHFWAFGGGTLADFWCHYADLAHWGLGLKYPVTVEASGPAPDPEVVPVDLVVRYEYPARGQQPAVKLTWYQGSGNRPAQLTREQKEKWPSGVLFVGARGQLLADYNRWQLLPEAEFSTFSPPPPSIPNSIGHHAEWILACKSGGQAHSHFDYAGPLSEAGLLGNVAFRVGKNLDWDAAALKARNCPEADHYIQHHYRDGWKL